MEDKFKSQVVNPTHVWLCQIELFNLFYLTLSKINYDLLTILICFFMRVLVLLIFLKNCILFHVYYSLHNSINLYVIRSNVCNYIVQKILDEVFKLFHLFILLNIMLRKTFKIVYFIYF